MPADIGSQIITLKFFDPVDSFVVNRLAKETRRLGLYSGGYLTSVSDVSVSLSPLICEIGDGTYQVRGETGVAVSVTVASATPYVVLRWIYTGSASVDYMAFLAVASGSILATDVVVGKCVFAGATLTGFDYALRTNPNVMHLFLRAEPLGTPAMRVMVRAGRVNYGTLSVAIPVQQSPLFVAPGSLSRIDLVQITAAGAVIVTQGTAAASPVAPSYNGLVTVAEVRLSVGQTTIISSSITDVRSFVATGFDLGTSGLVPQGGIILWSGTIASIQTGWHLCDGTNGTPNLSDRFVIHADADIGGTNNVGATGGENSHVLTVAELAPHHHQYTRGQIVAQNRDTQYSATWATTYQTLDTTDTGGGAAHENRPKFYALAYIMKV